MSNTNVPPGGPPSQQSLIDALRNLAQAFQDADRNETQYSRAVKENTNSLKNLSNSIRQNFNITKKMTEAVNRLDRNNLKALATGTTYNKFLESNTAALKDLRAGFRETVEVQLSNFAAGIRVNSTELNDLNQELLLTGQNTKALEGVNSQLLAITGKDVRAVDTAARINKEVSDKFLISNDRLIQTLESLAGELDKASLFGTDAVEAISRVSQELQGMVGVGMTSQIQTAISILQPSIDNIATQVLTGSEGLAAKLAQGTLETEDLRPLFKRILEVNERTLATNDPRVAGSLAASQLGLSESQNRSLLQLARNFENQVKVEDEARKTAKETEETLRTAREKANNFFDNVAPVIAAGVVPIAPAIYQLGIAMNAAGLLGNAGGLFGRGAGKAGARAGVRAGLKTMGKRALGAVPLVGTALGGYDAMQGDTMGAAMSFGMTGAAVGGPIGAVVGAGVGYLAATMMNTEKTADEIAKENESRDRERREKEARNRAEIDQLTFMAQYLRRNSEQTVVSDPRTQDLIVTLIKENQATRRKIAEVNRNPGVK